MKQIKTIFLAVLAALSPACGQSASHHAQAGDSLFTIREQGSFLIGGTADETVKATPDDQFWFENFRMGVWPHYYQGSQFPRSAEALEQFFRQMTPNTGAYDEGLIATDVAALMDKTGGGILVTHSQGGGPGWHAAIKSANVRAVVVLRAGQRIRIPRR